MITSDAPVDLQKTANKTIAAFGARPDLIGKRYSSLLRCSTDAAAVTSPAGQKEVNDAFASFNGMNWSGRDVYAEGVSGSQTFNREDIQEILDLKKRFNDFEVVVVFELGRATRGGIRHGNVVEDELRKAGIELISSTEMIPDGPMGELIKCVKHFANQQQAFNISKAVARGLAQSLAKADRPAAGRTPYGLDRMYVDPDGTPRTIIRWEGTTQLRIDPHSKTVIGRATCPPRRKARKKGQRREHRDRFVGYRKQEDERSYLVPSGGSARETMIEIMRMYYCQDIGSHRIIKHLRSKGIASPFGGDWCIGSIQKLVRNPIYLGIEVRHRYTRALYHKLGPDGPIPVTVDQDKLHQENRISLPQNERSRDEWVLVDKPKLKEFLPPDVREVAVREIVSLLDADAVKKKQLMQSKRKHKHGNSLYVLSHLLHSGINGHAMRGDTNTRMLKGGKKVKRYYFDYSTASAAISGLPARRVPAEPLEEAVVEAVFQTLLDHDWIAKRVRERVTSLGNRTGDVAQQRAKLVAEREEIARRLARIHKTSGHLSDEELGGLLAADQDRQLEIRRLLGDLDHRETRRLPTAPEAVKAVTARLSLLPTSWKKLPRPELKNFLAAVVEDLKIDLATLKTTFTLRMPERALNPLPKSDPDSRLNFTSVWSCSHDTEGNAGLKLHEISCQHDRKNKCYSCSRRKLAA